MDKELLESVKKDGTWIEFFYPEWGWRTAYWNGAAWSPPRQGNPPTECREIKTGECDDT